MSEGRAPSLKWRLVRRLVALQSAMLTLLALLVICTLWGTGYLVSLEAEDDIIDAVQSAVTRDAADGLALRDTPALAKQRADVPDLWFIVRDRQGHSISEGAVPPEYAGIGAALDGIGQARLGWAIGDPPRPTARVKWVEAPAGRIQIIAGPGGTVALHRVALAASTLFMSGIVPVLVLMAAATLIATPMVVRTALAGLAKAAAQAERINVDRRGTRLPVDDVPTEVIPLVTAVNDALGRIDDGYERHKRFLLDAAHELRTPIAILQTRLELLPPGPETTRLLEDVARLSILAEQLLDLQRLNHNPARFLPVDLVAVGRQVATDLAPLAIAAGYDVEFEPETEHVGIMGDQISLERALTNLVQNAIQHGGRRGIITIGVTRTGSISVTDDGPGVPPEHRDRVFEPFHRLQARDRGVGLGLNLVQEIVRLHYGQITVLDGPTGGACFTMTFPQVARSSAMSEAALRKVRDGAAT
jgi:signal transduction histidine kinase